MLQEALQAVAICGTPWQVCPFAIPAWNTEEVDTVFLHSGAPFNSKNRIQHRAEHSLAKSKACNISFPSRNAPPLCPDDLFSWNKTVYASCAVFS